MQQQHTSKKMKMDSILKNGINQIMSNFRIRSFFIDMRI